MVWGIVCMLAFVKVRCRGFLAHILTGFNITQSQRQLYLQDATLNNAIGCLVCFSAHEHHKANIFLLILLLQRE